MKLRKGNKRRLAPAATATAGLLLMVPFGQVNAADDKPMDEMIVYGPAAAAQSQLNAKRLSDNISDSIFAEDMGKMPDRNIAEAMQRITGIGIDRANGEGSSITIRGVEGALNNVYIDGVLLTNGGDDNTIDFSTMSAGMLSSIEVIKTPSANHDEGSIGGTVKLKSLRPLTQKKNKMSFVAEAQQNSLAEDTDANIEGSIVQLFSVDNIEMGVASSFFYDNKNTRQDVVGLGTWGVKNVKDVNGDTVAAYVPKHITPNMQLTQRERYGGKLTFEVVPDDQSTLVLDLSYSMTTRDRESHNTKVTSFTDDVLIDDETGSAISGVRNKSGGSNILSRSQITETESYTVGLTYQLDLEDWQLVGKVDASRSTEDWVKNRRANFKTAGKTNIEATFQDGDGFHDIPTLTPAFGENGFYDPSTSKLFQLFDDVRDIDDEYNSISIDLERDLDWGPVTSIEIGAKYFERTKFRSQSIGETRFNSLTDDEGNKLSDVFLSDVSTAFPIDDYFDGIANNAIDGWRIPDVDLIFDLYPVEETRVDPLGTYTVKTQAAAAYAKANFTWFDERLSGDFGVRVVRDKTRSTGDTGINFPNTTVNEAVDQSASYTNVLPSLNMRYLLTDDMLLRFSVGKVMARPKQTDLRPGLEIKATNLAVITEVDGELVLKVDDDGTFSAGNVSGKGGDPLLEITTAWQYDLSWEWYFADTGLVSVAAFYKDLESIIYTRKEDIFVDCPAETSAEDCAGLLINQAVLGPVPVKRAVNGDGGTILGFELAYQSDFSFLSPVMQEMGEVFDNEAAFTHYSQYLQDFGAVLNYTYTDSEGRYVDASEDNSAFYKDFPFQKTSKDTFNATLYWQRNGHSIRLAYNYRSANLDSPIGPVDVDSSVWVDDFESLDLSGVIALTEYLELTFSATNLTNESKRTFSTLTIGQDGLAGEGNALDGAPDWRTRNFNNSGRTYRVGLVLSL